MGKYRRFRLQIKEKGNDRILCPEYYGYVDEDFLIDFFGLRSPDVEWYKIEALDKN